MDIDQRLLYRWRDQLEPPDKSEWSPPQNSRESTLRKEISQLKRVLAEKTLKLNFFKSALQKSREGIYDRRPYFICGQFVDKLNWPHVALKLDNTNVTHGGFKSLCPINDIIVSASPN